LYKAIQNYFVSKDEHKAFPPCRERFNIPRQS